MDVNEVLHDLVAEQRALDEIVADQIRTDLPEIAAGDTVRVSVKVVEGNRERIQVFEGTVMRMRGGGITRSITSNRARRARMIQPPLISLAGRSMSASR